MNEKIPLVSVLMTSFNREKYIGEAIESVLASTYTNFELIITDDRSTDNTVTIAKTFGSKDQRVKLFINERTWVIIRTGINLRPMHQVNTGICGFG